MSFESDVKKILHKVADLTGSRTLHDDVDNIGKDAADAAVTTAETGTVKDVKSEETNLTKGN